MMHRVRARASLSSLGFVLARSLVATPAFALDPFEIQVYDGTANAPGVPGLELHLNRFATGRFSADPPEAPLHGQTHATLEPSFGIKPWWEIGGYFQTALAESGDYSYAGVKLRSKFVSPPSFHPSLRIGLNAELSLLPQRYDRDRWGGELRPIIAWEGDGWLVAANPIVSFHLAGQGLHDGPEFEPAVKLARGIAGLFAVGVEYYGSTGPIAHPASSSNQPHTLFGVIDLIGFRRVEVNLGLGGGITAASTGLVGKIILGTTFEGWR